MSNISKFGQEALLRTTKVVVEGGIDYVKQNVNFGFETKISSQSTPLKQTTNNILGEEAKIQNSVTGAHKTTSKLTESLGLEAALLNAALNPPKLKDEKLPNSLERKLTDAYYNDVKKIYDKYKETIISTDNLYDKEIQQYYKDLKDQGKGYSDSSKKSQELNNDLIKKYYDSIETIVEKQLGAKKINANNIIIKTQKYYLAVRGISLAFKTYKNTKTISNKKAIDLYYKSLTDFSTFGTSSKNNKLGYEVTLGKKDNFDESSAKTQTLREEKINQEKKIYYHNPDILSGMQTMWAQDPDFVNLKNKEGKYKELIDYVNKVYLTYLTSDVLAPVDVKENLSEELLRISQDKKEIWDLYHSYDTISPEMRAAIIFSQGSDVDSNNLEEVQKLIAPNPKSNLVASHNVEITKAYLENTEYILKEEVNVPQTVLKKGFTIVNSDGKLEQIGVTSPNKPYSATMADLLTKSNVDKTGAYRFFFEKLHGKEVGYEKFNKCNLIDPKKKYSEIPNRMVFPAYIEAYNDSYDVNSNTYEFSGKAEPFYVYKNTGRTLSLQFFMISDYSAEMLIERLNRTNKANPIYAVGTSSSEIIKNLNEFFIDWGSGAYALPNVIQQNGEYGFLGWQPGQYSGTTEHMWARMTFLAQCCYPWFRKDGKLKEQPLARIRIGDFIDQVIKIKSLNFDEYEEFNMDLTGTTSMGAYPMGVKCALTADIIHSEEPHSNYNKFYWRKKFDTPGKDILVKQSSTKATSENTEEIKLTTKTSTEPVLPIDLTSRISNLGNLTKSGSKSDIDNTNVRKDNGGVYVNEGNKVQLQKNLK